MAGRLWGRSPALAASVLFAVLAGGCTSAPPAASPPTGGSSATPSAPTSEPATSPPASVPESPSPTAAASAPSSASCQAGADPRTAIKASAQAQLDAPSYRAETRLTDPSGKGSTTVIEYQAPDRIHVKFSSPEATTEQIQIGSSSWLKVGNTAWQPGPGVNLRNILEAARQFTLATQIKEATYVGSETVAGTRASVYQYTADFSVGGSAARSQAKLWASTADCRPLRAEATVATNVGGREETRKIVETYSYVPVTIEAPR